jgi:hypothetical protein
MEVMRFLFVPVILSIIFLAWSLGAFEETETFQDC